MAGTRAAAEKVGEKVSAYWGKKWDNLVDSDAVKDAAPLVTGAVNVAIAGVLLRLALPRIAALQAVGGFDELAEFFNLPPRAELSGYLDQLQGLNVGLVFAVYFALFAAEKLTMTDEFLPIGLGSSARGIAGGVWRCARGHDANFARVHYGSEPKLLAGQDGAQGEGSRAQMEGQPDGG